MIATLSLAIDLGMGQPMQSMVRSPVLAIRLGEALRLSDEELATVYYLALLRWIGCTSDASLAASAFGDELVASTWFPPVEKHRAPHGGAHRNVPNVHQVGQISGHGLLGGHVASTIML